MRGAWHGIAATVGVVVGALVPAGLLGAATPTGEDVDLLEQFAPVVAVREQRSPCEEGERFLPVAVDAVLGRDDVVLRDGDGTVVVTAPTAADLAAAPEDRWLDLPGNTLRPECTYEEWFRTLDADPAVYGRVSVDGDRLVLQYWFFWVYNQWNDVHEGDWEMVQLVFDGDDRAAAAADGPSVYAYAQHEGSELADPDAGKVRLVDGDHPVVYAAEGSHAAFFSSSRWFGKSGATGFGCDDTSAPTVLVRPEVIPIPADAPVDGELAWLSFRGHWGERAPAFNDGPTGPVTKDQWDEPVRWVDEEGRDSAVALPFATSSATDAFCDLSAAGSALFNRLLDQPVVALALLALAVAVVVLVVRTSSRGVLGRAATTWRAHAATLVPIGGVVLAGAVAAGLLQRALLRWTDLDDLVEAVGPSSAWVLPLVALVSSVVAIPVAAWVVAAAITAVSAPAAGSAPPGSRAGRAQRPRWAAVGAAIVLIVAVQVSLLALALPLAVLLVSRWMLAPVRCARSESTVAGGLVTSHRLLRGHGWRAAGMVVTLLLVASLAGVAGALVLLLTPATFAVAGLVVAVVGVVLVPYLGIVLAHFHDEVTAPT